LRLEDEGGEVVPLGASIVPEAAAVLTGLYAEWGQPEAAHQASTRARAASRASGDFLAEGLTTINELIWVAIPFHTERVEERHRLATRAEEALRRVQDVHPDLPVRFGWLPVLVPTQRRS
jgi:hypothetical protein